MNSCALYYRVIWLGGLCLFFGGLFIILFGYHTSLLLTLFLAFGIWCIYVTQRSHFGPLGRLGVAFALVGYIFMGSVAYIPILTAVRQAVRLALPPAEQVRNLGVMLLFFLFGVFEIFGFILFGLITLRTKVVSTLIGFGLILTPFAVFIPFVEIRQYVIGSLYLFQGYLLGWHNYDQTKTEKYASYR